MSKARTLANLISDNAELADGQISVAEVVGAAPTASPTFTGNVGIGLSSPTAAGLEIRTEANNTYSDTIQYQTFTGDSLVIYNNPSSSSDDYVSINMVARGAQTAAMRHIVTSPGGGDTNYIWQFRDSADTSNTVKRMNYTSDGDQQYYPLTGTTTVFNEYGVDHDFRVESDSSSHALFVNAGNNRVGINQSSPQKTFDVNGTIMSAGSSGGFITLKRDDTTLTNNVDVGAINFETTDADDAGVAATILASGDGTLGGVKLRFYAGKASNKTERLTLYNSGAAVLNEGGLDHDFRVESDTDSHALFVDASSNRVGIGDSAPSNKLHVNAGSASDIMRLDNSSGGYVFGYTTNLASIDLFSTAALRVRHGSTESMRLKAGEAVFNEIGADIDFRVESDSNSHMLFVDAGNDKISIASSTPDSVARLTVNGPIRAGDWGYASEIKNFSHYHIGNSSSSNKTYVLLAKKYVGTALTATGVSGKIYLVRGTSTAWNDGTAIDVNIRVAYNSNQYRTWISNGYHLRELTYNSEVYYGFEIPQTGTRSVYFSGEIISQGDGFRPSIHPASDITVGSIVLQSNQHRIENTWMNNSEGPAIFNESSGDHDFRVESDGNTAMIFVDASIDSVRFGKTDGSNTTAGMMWNHNDYLGITHTSSDAGDRVLLLNRQSGSGHVIEFRRANAGKGVVGIQTDDIYLGTGATGLKVYNAGNAIHPFNTSSRTNRDNAIDLGMSTIRFDDIYATNGTIQTSDQNEKQQIAALTDAEITAAKAISKLFKTFKWNDKVEAKGDAARKHTGVIAQQVEQAMADAGLDAGDYAFFTSTTWWEDAKGEQYYTADDAPEGATERTRRGIRYPELLSFIGAATEQRLTSIEARLDALET